MIRKFESFSNGYKEFIEDNLVEISDDFKLHIREINPSTYQIYIISTLSSRLLDPKESTIIDVNELKNLESQYLYKSTIIGRIYEFISRISDKIENWNIEIINQDFYLTIEFENQKAIWEQKERDMIIYRSPIVEICQKFGAKISHIKQDYNEYDDEFYLIIKFKNKIENDIKELIYKEISQPSKMNGQEIQIFKSNVKFEYNRIMIPISTGINWEELIVV